MSDRPVYIRTLDDRIVLGTPGAALPVNDDTLKRRLRLRLRELHFERASRNAVFAPIEAATSGLIAADLKLTRRPKKEIKIDKLHTVSIPATVDWVLTCQVIGPDEAAPSNPDSLDGKIEDGAISLQGQDMVSQLANSILQLADRLDP